jgi:hydrogenase maturation protease
VLRLDARCAPIPQSLFPHSTHALGVAHAVELTRSLGELPDELIIYGMQGAIFAAGVALSAPVAGAMDETLQCVRQEVMHLHERTADKLRRLG